MKESYEKLLLLRGMPSLWTSWVWRSGTNPASSKRICIALFEQLFWEQQNRTLSFPVSLQVSDTQTKQHEFFSQSEKSLAWTFRDFHERLEAVSKQHKSFLKSSQIPYICCRPGSLQDEDMSLTCYLGHSTLHHVMTASLNPVYKYGCYANKTYC